MVTQNMLRTREGKQDFSNINFKVTTDLDLNKWHKQIKITDLTPLVRTYC